jgi:dsDNA-binding SOS-regulon protein
MDMLKKFLTPSSKPDILSEMDKLVADPEERFIKVKGWLESLSPSDRARFSEKYLVPVFGEEAAAWLKQQLIAERAEKQVALDMQLAQIRTQYTKDVQPIILGHISETLQKIDIEANKAKFKTPVLKTLWNVAVARTGLDIIASGQTTYDKMLNDFDKLIEVVIRMEKTYEAEQQSNGQTSENT